MQAPSCHVLDRAQIPPEREEHAGGAPLPAPAPIKRFTCLHLPAHSHVVGITSPHVQMISFPSGSEGKESTCNLETQVRSLGWEDPLEEGMATHSSVLAWRIPWTEEPGGLQSLGSQRADMIQQLTLSRSKVELE